MRPYVLAAAAAALLLSVTASALPPQPIERGRHFIFEPQHPLQAEETAALAAEGLTIQSTLGANRYLVRVREGADAQLAGDSRVRSLQPYGAARKVARSAYAEAAKGRAFVRLRVKFHDDVALDDAREAIALAGGTVERPLLLDFELPHVLTVRVPSAELQTLAEDDRVFGIYGRPLRVKALNVRAAALSKVTPLFSAPYNLSGDGVVLSEFELATADTAHIQFGGRLTAHFQVTGNSLNQTHATHVAGTMISAGVDDPSFPSSGPLSKGMAPKATLHEFNATDDFGVVVSNKDTQLKPLGIVADNNSWDFALAWQDTNSGWVWEGGEDYYGGYDSLYSTPYDAVTVKSSAPLFVHAAGNDADNGNPGPILGDFSPHKHTDDNGLPLNSETFCYSKNGSGTDCPAPQCSAGISAITHERHCETHQHPIYGPFSTVGIEASLKNNLTVGATDPTGVLASFSSRGPTRDGRVKPELVAKGTEQFSTVPRSYATLGGTSMATPVVTGIAALITEQWRKTFNQQNPPAAVLKTLLIAGADDQVGTPSLDQPGPDYSYGFGLVDAKASVDLIIADGGNGTRIRTGTVHNGDTVTFPLTLSAAQSLLRVDLGWFDPEIEPPPDERGDATLVNDLDIKVMDPSGNTILPYVLDKNHPNVAATRGVNTTDTTEVVEIRNAPAGSYSVVVTAKLGDPASHPTQDFVVIANAPLIDAAAQCGDIFEPNNSEASAFRFLDNGSSVAARTCSPTDIDFYTLNVQKAGPVSAVVTASDTALRVTLSGVGLSPLTAIVDVPAGATRTVSATAATPGNYLLKVEPVGTVGTSNAYTITTSIPEVAPNHRRAARH